eukprot:Em0001g1871a
MSAATLIPRHQATNPVTLLWIRAPALFNHYAEALNWIMANNYGVQLLHYLDDFLLVGPPGKDTCPEGMSRVLLVCDLAAPTLGFFGFLRVCEFKLPKCSFDLRIDPTSPDISWSGEGIHFFIKRSRTNQMGKGTTICIGCTKGRDTCPVAAMEAYRECCRCSTHSTPLFHYRDGRSLTPKSFHSTFLSLVNQCGYDPAKYNTHSLHIGAATAAARVGLPTDTI